MITYKYGNKCTHNDFVSILNANAGDIEKIKNNIETGETTLNQTLLGNLFKQISFKKYSLLKKNYHLLIEIRDILDYLKRNLQFEKSNFNKNTFYPPQLLFLL
jgi:hypothetical protein